MNGKPASKSSGKQSGSRSATNQETIEMLQKAFRMEVETVINYLANSVHLDGMRAEEIKRALSSDIADELGHATRLANRLKQLGGRIPGSMELEFDQETLRPPQDTTDIQSVIEGVINAEESAVDHYRAIIRHTESVRDRVTADLATDLQADEEKHLTLFEGFRLTLECCE
ncbi:MAG: ferritin-like domain-containing protein [Planctomycetaceae bacterium]